MGRMDPLRLRIQIWHCLGTAGRNLGSPRCTVIDNFVIVPELKKKNVYMAQSKNKNDFYHLQIVNNK